MALKDHYDNLNEAKADVLHEAREVLIERGWAQYTLEDTDGHVCFVGAINTVFFGEANAFTHGWKRKVDQMPIQRRYIYLTLGNELRDHFIQFLAPDEPVPNLGIEYWNDREGRTMEEVEKVMLERADYYERRYLEGYQS